MAFLDPELDVLLATKKYFEQHPSEGGLDFPPDKPLYISLKYKGDIHELQELGFTTSDADDGIAFGVTDLAGLVRLNEHPNVLTITKQRRSTISLDGSIPDIKANQVWTRSGDDFTGYTGRDVMVGIIDTGIDFRHHAFRKKTNGKTRIFKIWDQTLIRNADESSPGAIADATIATTPTPLGYGVEYTDAAIDNTLENEHPTVPVRHVDADGHGTHVAGTAAGDGSQSGRCKGAYSYIGVAPEATLIVVRLWGLTDGDASAPPSPNSLMLDAIRYIINEAKVAGKKVAINLSLGRFTSQMDGTSDVCVKMDTLLTNNSVGTAIVFAAGNAANKGFRAALTVPGDTTTVMTLPFIMDASERSRTQSIMYSGSNLQIQLTSPVGGTNGKITWVSSGNTGVSTTANGTGGNVAINNTPNRINITITPPASGKNRDGEWKLEFKNTNTTPTALDAFCFGGHGWDDPHYMDHLTSRSTLDEYATCLEAMSVGAYNIGGGLADFSSRGPTLDAAARTKPEFCAPGVDIAAPGIRKDRTEASDYLCFKACCCDCCQDYYVDLQGTSMAAPHVAGLIALMLHKNPTLTHTQIRQLIKDNCRARDAGATPNEILGWGTGRIDALAVLGRITQVNPPATATGVTPFAALPSDPFGQLQERFLGTERGEEIIEVAKKYFEEVRMMINRNKRVATVWHRCQGPAWVRVALRSFYAPEIPLPEEVNGILFNDAIQKIKDIVKRYASSSMLEDISRFEVELDRLRLGVRLNELVEIIGKRPVAEKHDVQVMTVVS